MPALPAWCRGGPADGRHMMVELHADGTPPEQIVLPQTGMYLGAQDTPTTPTNHHYHLAAESPDTDELVYRYNKTTEWANTTSPGAT